MSNKLSINKVALSVILSTGALFTSPIWAANFYVSDQRNNSHFNTLKEALTAAGASQDATNTIFLHKNVSHNYAQDNNGNSNFIFSSALTIDGSGVDGNARHTIDFTGINNISLTKDLELKNVHLIIQPLDSSLASAIAGAGSGQANELDPKIYLNGYKLTLDNVDTNSTKLHAKTRPNIYLGSDGSTNEQGGHGELLVVNSKPNENPSTVLKNIILGNGNTKVTLNTKSDVLGHIHFSTDKNNNEAINGTVDLIFDSYRKQLNIHKPQGNEPTINLSLTDFNGKDIPAFLYKLNNLTLNNSTPNIKHEMTISGTLTLNDTSSNVKIGDPFNEDAIAPLTVNNINSQGGNITIEDGASLNITGELRGSSLKIDNKGTDNFSFNNHSDYTKEDSSNGFTYKPRNQAPMPSNDSGSSTDQTGGTTPTNNNQPNDSSTNGNQAGQTSPSSPTDNGEQPSNGQDPKKEETPPSPSTNNSQSETSNPSASSGDVASPNKDPKDPTTPPPGTMEGVPPPTEGNTNPSSPEANPAPETTGNTTEAGTNTETSTNTESDANAEAAVTNTEETTAEEPISSDETTRSTEESSTAPTPAPATPASEAEVALNVVHLKPTFEFFAPYMLLNQLQNPHRTALSRVTSAFSGDHVWVAVENQYAKQQETHRLLGYQVKETGISLGAETEVINGKVGVSISYSQPVFSHTEQGEIQAKTWQTFVYANKTMGSLSTYGYAGMGYSDLLSQDLVRTQKNRFHAISVQTGIGIGYPVKFSQVTFTPTLEANYAWLHTSARATQNFPLPATALQSLIVRSGATLSIPLSERFNLNTLAAIGLETFKQNLRASYVRDQTLYQMQTEQPHRISGQLGMSMSYRFSPATELEVGYQAELKKGYANHKGNVSLKVVF